MGQKSKKGEIAIFSDNGWIRLRWRYRGERYSFSTGSPYKRNFLKKARDTAALIRSDIETGNFDETLERYKTFSPYNEPATNMDEKLVPGEVSRTQIPEIPPAHQSGSIQPTVIIQPEIPLIPYPGNTIDLQKKLSEFGELFKYWVKNIRSIDLEKSAHYLDTLELIVKRWPHVLIQDLPVVLNSQNWSASTFNSRRDCLCSFFTWLKGRELLSFNILSEVRRKKRTKDLSGRRTPLERREIIRILHAIEFDIYCHPCSRFKHSHYYPFLLFLVLTGVRPAEAVGLRVKHVNLYNKTIEISEALARTPKGTNAAARIRKGTKRENTRFLPMSPKLDTLLRKQILGKSPDDLVFQSHHGLAVDDRMFLRRVLKPILAKLEIAERVVYVFRHTFGTEAINQGILPTEVAYALGDDVETVFRNYINVQKPPTRLPDIV